MFEAVSAVFSKPQKTISLLRLAGLRSKYPKPPPRPVTKITFLLHADEVRTSQESHLWTSTFCYENSFTVYM
jgi:hypothetical protein